MEFRRSLLAAVGLVLFVFTLFDVGVGQSEAVSLSSGGMVNLLTVVTVLTTVQVQGSARNRLFRWTRHPEDYVSEGKTLIGHYVIDYSHKYVSSQCALQCLRHHECKSFNFNRETGRCVLNNATHVTNPLDFMDSKESEYHVRESFSIDPEALGPCATNPCNDRGRCIETKNPAGDLMAVCLCNEEWTGSRCQHTANAADWDEWEEWGQCSVTCHRGWRMRKRKCKDHVTGKTVSSLECHGADVEYSACVLQECPKWKEWGDWGPCSASKTCGRGIKIRHRHCSNGGVPGVDRYCIGSTNESAPCHGIDCTGAMRLQGGVAHGEGRLEVYNDVTGQWGQVCADQLKPIIADLACIQIGFPGAHAVVADSRYGGGSSGGGHIALTNVSCQGRERTLLECPHNDWAPDGTCKTGVNAAAGLQCNVNGAWSLWNSWSDCSVTCENGTRQRKRMCNHPPQMHGGKACEGEDVQYKPCRLDMCPSLGTWGNWREWSTCNTSECTQSRDRTCAAVPCEGHNQETRTCQDASRCEGVKVDGRWNDWGEWSECSTSCSNGTQDRTRSCKEPEHGGADCTGENSQRQRCKLRECPVDGIWNTWGTWGECSLTCGNGTRSRTRTCNGPFHEGQDCVGSHDDWEPCATNACPVDGEWLPWAEWQPCNVTCDGGVQVRERKCNAPKHGGDNCAGVAMEVRSCGHTPCPIDGVWLDWSTWTLCSVTCGYGFQYRNRSCHGPFYKGRDCIGDAEQSRECHPRMCPVDGQWMDWVTWSPCTASCGTGTRMRTRECYNVQHGGQSCGGEATETEECGTEKCPVDGEWLEWAEWNACSTSCGDGIQVRTRGCNGPSYGGANCSGVWEETQPCHLRKCPVDGKITEWSAWSSCTLACGGGQRSRRRECHGPFHGGKMCPEHLKETDTCNEQPCPVDGVFREWEEWSSCGLSCGGGTRERRRACDGPRHGGANCSGAWAETEPCNVHHCPVDGKWMEWSNWTECSLTCGGGSQWRNRTCEGPWYGGVDCGGPANQTRPCNEKPCPEDGRWLPWTTWEKCSATCGGGEQRRERTCAGVQRGGKNCTGDSLQTRSCNTHECPVDGVLSDWSEWSECALTCGGGSQWRNRTCTGPFFGGSDCIGMRNESRACNSNPCPVDGYYRDWQAWGACSVDCGGGTQHRTRTCVPPRHEGQPCPGPAEETQECNTHHCPVNGYYHEWSDWSHCSRSCGGGSQWRDRKCEPPKYGGNDCEGPANETQACETKPCPIDGIWNDWSEWSGCNATCGGGTRERMRVCIEPQHGGAPCTGRSTEYKPCAENHCPIPGDWLPWTTWSECSVTCGGGTRDRSRECNMTSHGNLTAPCEGSVEAVEDCHTHSCTPYARTCSEWKERGLNTSTIADIDPDGAQGKLKPVEIYCDFESTPGSALTVIGHNSEVRTQVQGWEGAREYEQYLTYNISFDHVVSIIDQSAFCSQYIRWECKAALIHNPNDNNKVTTGWYNRSGLLADYFGGAEPGSSSCACGMTNDCAKDDDKQLVCNCDKNDGEWRVDDGDLSFKSDLPVTAFVAGDTGEHDKEFGFFTVGKVSCRGFDSE